MTIAVAGLTLMAVGLAARQTWLDRHFMPSFLLPRLWYVRIETTVRLAVACAGVLLVLGARQAVRRASRRTVWRGLQVAGAIVLALAASELALRRLQMGQAEWRDSTEEPRRRADGRLGWTFAAARTASVTSGGRTIEYAFDAAGRRVQHENEAVDPDRPALVFVGESVMFGEGLQYEETVPAQVAEMLKTPSANLAVSGFSTDQMYLRLLGELPEFRRPVAVVTLFMTALFGRNLEDDRPHLGPGLVWKPANPRAKLMSLALVLVPFRREATVERGIATTREVLAATVDLARSRGATPLIVVPRIGAEEEQDRWLRRRILDEPGLPYAPVDLDPAWHLPWNRHPDARAAHAIALAVAERLRPSLTPAEQAWGRLRSESNSWP